MTEPNVDLLDRGWGKWTDEQLAADADRGLSGQGSTVEMMRRLRNATLDQMKATNRLTRWITFLTWALVLLTIVQVAFIIENYVGP